MEEEHEARKKSVCGDQGNHELMSKANSDALFMHPMWSRDLKIQIISRLHRTGQKNTINFTTLMARGSLDDTVEDRQGTKAENKDQSGRRHRPLHPTHDGDHVLEP